MITKVYSTRKISKRLVGYIKTTGNDFHEEAVPGQPNKVRRVPNQNFYKKVKKELDRDWQDDFSWKPLSEIEVEELTSSYERKGAFCLRQANRLNTLKSI